MKKIYALTLSLAVVLSACSKNEDGSTTVTIPPVPPIPSLNDVTHAASQLTNMGNLNETTQEMKQTMESLKSLTPVSNDQLKSLMPESFNSIKRSSFEISKKLGASTLNCEFKENNVSYTISIYDGAGEVGSGIAALKMLGINLNAESENEKGYKKNITLGNARGTEIQTDKNELKLLVGDRFFMEISATGADMESIKTGIKKAKLIEKLEDLK
jgi:hypothetical protein